MENLIPGTTLKNSNVVSTHVVSPTQGANAQTTDEINLREILFKYLGKWYWFLLSAFVCLVGAYAYLKVTNELYQVQTSILLRKDQGSAGLIDMSMLDGLGVSGSSKEVEDEIQVLTSKSIVASVIKSLHIETQYFRKSGWKYTELYPVTPIRLIVPAYFNDTTKQVLELRVKRKADGYVVKYMVGQDKREFTVNDLNRPIQTPVGILRFAQVGTVKVGESFKMISYPMNVITESLSTSINVAAVNKKANAITISTVAENCPKAKDVLNKLVELYNEDAVTDKNKIATNTADFVDDRLRIISGELQDVEMNVESYKREKGLTDLSSEAEIFLKSASEYDNKLAELETQLNLVGYIETYVKDGKNQYNLVPANLGIEDKSLLQLVQEYNQALLERMKLQRTTNEKNPVLIQMEQQLKEIRKSIIVSIQSIKDGVRIALKDVKGKNRQFASKIKEVPTQERQFIEIKRQQEIKQKLYLFLLQKREENALSLASTIPSAKTLDLAYASMTPVAPKRMMILLVALLLGLVVPVGVIYLKDLLNDKISDKKELLRLLKVPFLGSIAVNKEADRIVVREGKTTPLVEMFRLIRTNMNFVLGGVKSPVILVTSTISGEGKSFTAINMAMTFALLKKRVVLVGLDVRNPMLGEYLHIPKSNGVTLYLADSSYKPHDIIVPSGFHDYLDVIPAGPIPPNPAELLMNPRLEELFSSLKNEYDYIIVDSAPVGVISDTYLLSRIVDNCIYVVRRNYTPREATALINDIYKHKRINKIGVVLNGTDESLGYGYGYGYGYGSSNGNSSQKSNTTSVIFKRIRNK
ncbi:MAG TPA: polysaccharide biosynthesis tyrosine autokinase [Paludibacter sp.]|nr:polysaccharide biosynthesis tyrosine autokinase [Paludibacter sp.]